MIACLVACFWWGMFAVVGGNNATTRICGVLTLAAFTWGMVEVLT